MKGETLMLNVIVHHVSYVDLSWCWNISEWDLPNIVREVCAKAHYAVHCDQHIGMSMVVIVSNAIDRILKNERVEHIKALGEE